MVIARPFSGLLPALLNSEGDGIVSGLRIEPAIPKNAMTTRPYFWSIGRFAVRVGSQLARKRCPQPCRTAHWLCGQRQPWGRAGKILFALNPHALSGRGRNERGSDAGAAALSKLSGIERRQAMTMAIADVCLLLPFLFIGIILLLPLMRKPLGGAGGGGH